MYKNKKSGIIGIVVTIIILILIVIFSNGKTNSNFFENAATNLIMPIQNGLTYLKNKLSGNSTFFADINNLKQENENLQKKNDELEQSLRELENIKTQNATLKEYLNLALFSVLRSLHHVSTQLNLLALILNFHTLNLMKM